jgi:hypothetical protein
VDVLCVNDGVMVAFVLLSLLKLAPLFKPYSSLFRRYFLHLGPDVVSLT